MDYDDNDGDDDCEEDDDVDTQKHHPKYQWYEEGTLDISNDSSHTISQQRSYDGSDHTRALIRVMDPITAGR